MAIPWWWTCVSPKTASSASRSPIPSPHIAKETAVARRPAAGLRRAPDVGFQLRFGRAGRRFRVDPLATDLFLCLTFHGSLLPHGFAFHALRTRGADRTGLDLAYTAQHTHLRL